MIQERQARFSYKWVIAAISFLMVFTGLGFCSGTKSLFFRTISESQGIDRALLSLNDSVRYFTTAFLNLFFGVLVVKLGAKKMVLCGLTSLISSCLVYSCAEQLWVFYCGGVLLGVGLACCTTSLVGFVVSKWFTKNRGTVMGIILASNGVGAAVGTQIVSPLIYGERRTFFRVFGREFGYQDAYLLVAGILVVVAILAAALFREAPRGYVDDGSKPQKGKKKPARAVSWVGISYAEAVRTPYFYLVVLCVFLTGAGLQAANGVAAPHLEDVGMDTTLIATFVSLHSLVLAFAKILSGFCFDRVGLRATLLVSHIIAVVSIFMLSMVSGNTPGLAAAYEMLVSCAMPLETIMLPLIAADVFGDRDYAKMMGIMVAANTAGHATGVPVANLMWNLTGSYRSILVVFAALMVFVLVAFQLVLTQSGKVRKEKMGQV